MAQMSKLMLSAFVLVICACADESDPIGRPPPRDLTGIWGGENVELEVGLTESIFASPCGSPGRIEEPFTLIGNTFELSGVFFVPGGPGDTVEGRYTGWIVGDTMTIMFVHSRTEEYPSPITFAPAVYGEPGVFSPGPCPY